MSCSFVALIGTGGSTRANALLVTGAVAAA